MANLVAGRTVVPELIQDDFTPERVAAETVRFLTDDVLAAEHPRGARRRPRAPRRARRQRPRRRRHARSRTATEASEVMA